MKILSYFAQDIEIRDTDNYINAKQLCSTYNKRFRDWTKLKSAQAFLVALAEMTEQDGARKIPCTLIIQETDTIGGNGITWIHPDLAIEVARWLNPKFGVWCNRKIRELLITGQTKLEPELEAKRLALRKDITVLKQDKARTQAEFHTLDNWLVRKYQRIAILKKALEKSRGMFTLEERIEINSVSSEELKIEMARQKLNRSL